MQAVKSNRCTCGGKLVRCPPPPNKGCDNVMRLGCILSTLGLAALFLPVKVYKKCTTCGTIYQM